MTDAATICAIASPPGTGAISLLRLSGAEAYEIADRFIRFTDPEKSIAQLPANTIHFARAYRGEKLVDEVMVSLFRSPHSYTGEDLIEISCHGAVFIQQKLLEVMVSAGARLAEPGEFTLRAFINGKMDLSQAEAVADLIASHSAASHEIALRQMKGGFSSKLSELRKQLLDFASLIELELDFSEEDVEFANRTELRELVTTIADTIASLKASFEMGNVIKNGVPVAIAGKTNVGKSTLLNALLHDDRAIVSEIAGTTRDVIEDVMTMDGIAFRFIDTAGLRKTKDRIENIGIEKTFARIGQAYIVLYVIDATEEITEIDRLIGKIKERMRGRDQKLIILLNKIDFLSEQQLAMLQDTGNFTQLEPADDFLLISASYGDNIEALATMLIRIVMGSRTGDHEVIVTNARHYEALNHAGEAIERVAGGLEGDLSPDLLTQDIRQVLHYIGEITGEVTTDEILGNIFSKFCIGK